MNAATLDVLAAAWREAKAAEAAANARRLEIEAQLVAALPCPDAEGTVKATLTGAVVKVTHKLTRKVDSEALSAGWTNLTPAQRDCFRWKGELDIKRLRSVQELLPQEYAALAPYIETKPAKPSVSVEEA